MGIPSYLTGPFPRYPETVKIPGVRLWLEDLEDLYEILRSGTQRASIHPGRVTVSAVVDLKKARTRDLNNMQFRTEGPLIVIDFKKAKIEYSADVGQGLKTEIDNVIQGARQTWVRRFWDAESSKMYFEAGVVAGFIYYFPGQVWNLLFELIPASAFREFSNSMPGSYRDAFPSVVVAAAFVILGVSDRESGSVKVLPHSRGDFRQWIVQANMGLLTAFIILVLGIPVALLTDWLLSR
ncbi:hypothetical protein OHA02_52410 [Streptomyces phaeochromogenes]|nr:hypothetical protein [Streptomyces phaeochromogenes]